MAREKKLIVGAINVTMKNHTPERYLELFRDAFKLKTPVNISGDQYGLLANLAKLEKAQKEPGPITGDIFKYTNINNNAQWFNTSTNDFASDDEVGKINIPENLKPNSARFSYLFFPKQHLFFYEGYYDGNSFGPTNAERFVKRLLNTPDLLEKYGVINVTHVPDHDKVVDALKLKHKERIDLMVKRPNPDNHARAERKVMQRMGAMNVESFSQTYKAVQDGSIDVDDDLETMAHISAKNGYFKIKGKDDANKPVAYSTDNYPLQDKSYYDPDVELAFELFSRIANRLKNIISEQFRR
tara:strand:- start:1135 stop:2028 length:894 start_codon:yes stop_codon:yes gene_type:complete